MKFALIIYASLDTLTGGYLYDRRLVEALERRGDRVEIISLPWRDYARHLGDNLSPALLRRLAGLDVDILLQDELNHPSLFWLNHRLKKRTAKTSKRGEIYPILSIVHHLRSREQRPAWQNRLYRLAERRYLSGVDGFIFNSQSTRREVESLSGQGRPAVVAYPGGDRLGLQIEETAIINRARQPGPLRLFFVGGLIPRKGLHTLLDALSRLPGESWDLAVAGSPQFDPAYARAMQGRAVEYGLAERVRFLGPLNDASLAQKLLDSHVLVVPSSYEGFGIVYLEGMSAGLPAIATKAGAAGEIVTHGENGFLIAPGDASALAGHLQRLARDRECLLSLSLAARRRFERHPTWEASMDQIVDFLHSFEKRQQRTQK